MNPSRQIALVIVGILVAAAAAWVWLIPELTGPPTVNEFVDEWAPKLLEIGDTADLGGESEGYTDDDVFVRRFVDGTWIAARTIDYEYSHLPDAEAVDATVFADSEGAVFYVQGRHLCQGEVGHILREDAIETREVSEVWEAVARLGLREWKRVD